MDDKHPEKIIKQLKESGHNTNSNTEDLENKLRELVKLLEKQNDLLTTQNELLNRQTNLMDSLFEVLRNS